MHGGNSMRELKNKELIAGLVVLILLSVTAMILIVKKEVVKQPNQKEQIVAEAAPTTLTEDTVVKAETNQNDAVGSVADVSKETGSTEKNVLTTGQTGENYVAAVMKEYKGEEWQLSELFDYWNQYQLDAVADLIRLERVRTITDELKGTNYFYYYGDVDKNGKPSGKGLAVYADNTYYCGEWKAGVRSGAGMWLQIYPDKTATINGVKGVTEHLYNGTFLNDLPNGTGQEHFEYDLEIMNKNDAFANVIGEFKDGYYDGELYIMTIASNGRTTDWEADAKKGTFIKLKNVSVSAMGNEAVWENMEEDGMEDKDFYWIHPTKNSNYGIYGLKK